MQLIIKKALGEKLLTILFSAVVISTGLHTLTWLQVDHRNYKQKTFPFVILKIPININLNYYTGTKETLEINTLNKYVKQKRVSEGRNPHNSQLRSAGHTISSQGHAHSVLHQEGLIFSPKPKSFVLFQPYSVHSNMCFSFLINFYKNMILVCSFKLLLVFTILKCFLTMYSNNYRSLLHYFLQLFLLQISFTVIIIIHAIITVRSTIDQLSHL